LDIFQTNNSSFLDIFQRNNSKKAILAVFRHFSSKNSFFTAPKTLLVYFDNLFSPIDSSTVI